MLTARIDGAFGPITELALNRFQWNASAVRYRTKNRLLVRDFSPLSHRGTGELDFDTTAEIERWKANSYVATGDLVRIKLAKFSNIELGSSFKKLAHPSLGQDELVVANDLIECLKHANEQARSLSLRLVLNQTFRVSGTSLSGVVVTPATRSQHLIGHAFDCNIVDGGNWNNSVAFRNKAESQAARIFIKAMKDHGMRCGGDFQNVDTPHFDKRVPASSREYEFKYFFNQRMLSERQTIRLAPW